ncbi:DHA1 family inner membrane transport protein [Pullulanibacillus pueri]|uniref:MFS transporter n=1 Tax=Pullulanibacillus pueri TaxID=1437324 RepID=A0A8J2ZW86_9BACL|nr:MFS transporter [Pullulanibacillus pueri]MBM7682772.1 DHA1 family inner membrane transport protein [Pullulanibacillus pueri]GGH83126.1 MFS transporter [Pullulanibacillus pueri]
MKKKYPLPLWTLVIGAFAIGMTEFVIMGLLPNVAADLDVSVSSAGQLITGYALSVAIGGPIIVMVTYKLSQKNVLMLLMAIFVLGNFLSAIAPNYGLLMTSRVVTALAHGSFFGMGAIMAASLVAPNRQASAMALMFSGLTVSNIVGVPFGTFVGQHLGWRASFFIIALIGIVALLGLYFLVPKKEASEKASLVNELAVLKNGRLWLTLLISLFSISSVFALFTYISPILMQVTGFHESAVSLILVIFGVGVTVGNVVGGKLADWHINKAIISSLIVFELFFVLLYFMQFNKLWMVLGVFLFGVIAFAMLPSLQYRSMLVSKDAPTLSSTLNQSAMNVGNATGAFVGGLSVAYLPLKHLVFIAPLLSLIGFILLILQLSMTRKKTDPLSTTVSSEI